MWSVETLNDEVNEDLLNLPPKIQAKLLHILELLEQYGNEVREPHTKALGEGLFEIRAKGEEGIARAFFTFRGNRVILILSIFIKKTQKTPKKELDKARKILKELK